MSQSKKISYSQDIVKLSGYVLDCMNKISNLESQQQNLNMTLMRLMTDANNALDNMGRKVQQLQSSKADTEAMVASIQDGLNDLKLSLKHDVNSLQ